MILQNRQSFIVILLLNAELIGNEIINYGKRVIGF